MKTFKAYLAETEASRLLENSSAGATCAANVASATGAVGGLGVGFDGDHSRSIYPAPQKKSKKPVVLKR